MAALIQHITYNEFLPMMLGKEVMHQHDLVLLKVFKCISFYNTNLDVIILGRTGILTAMT